MTDRSATGGKIPVTPQMIRLAVKELHDKKVYVSSGLIAEHLRRCYPIESDPEILKREIHDGLEDAISVGLVAQCGPDAYCLPTFRQQATREKTHFTRFWEIHNRHGMRGRRLNSLKNPKKNTQKYSESNSSECSENEDEII